MITEQGNVPDINVPSMVRTDLLRFKAIWRPLVKNANAVERCGTPTMVGFAREGQRLDRSQMERVTGDDAAVLPNRVLGTPLGPSNCFAKTMNAYSMWIKEQTSA
ncbi:MAG: hypothetical protein M1600_12150 [Firmicutes bacterium]|nr:hypothetical protein [Bacillota bacterium]